MSPAKYRPSCLDYKVLMAHCLPQHVIKRQDIDNKTWIKWLSFQEVDINWCHIRFHEVDIVSNINGY